jgi:hypothetical protein
MPGDMQGVIAHRTQADRVDVWRGNRGHHLKGIGWRLVLLTPQLATGGTRKYLVQSAISYYNEHQSLGSTAEELAGDDFQGQNRSHTLKNRQHLGIDDIARDRGLFRIPPAAVQ